MGCTGSKTTTVKSNKTESSSSFFISIQEGITYLVQSLGVSDDSAKEVAERCSKDKDGKISKTEITDIEVEVKKTEEQFGSKFDEHKEDDGDYVSKDKAKEILKEVLPDFPKKKADDFIDGFAGDDDKINRKEFCLFYGNLKYRQNKIAEISDELEEDENGNVSADELQKLAVERGGLSERQAKKLIEVADKNDDGKLNKKEFKRACKRLTGQIVNDED